MALKAAAKVTETTKKSDNSSFIHPARSAGHFSNPFRDLQSVAGNRAVARYLQTKLRVGPSDDAFEREADRVAEQVVGTSDPVRVIARLLSPNEQRRAGGAAAQTQTETQQTMPGVGSDLLVEEAAPPQALQAKLELGHPDEPLERETDRIADRVTQMPTAPPTVSSRWTPPQGNRSAQVVGAPETLRAKTATTVDSVSEGAPAPPAVAAALARPGWPLDPSARAFFEPRFGRSLGHVRVHADAADAESAEAIGARAYTVGPDIVFARGEFAPHTPSGRLLIAHEITHVLQQTGGGMAASETADTAQRQEATDGKLVGNTPAPAAAASPAQQTSPPDEFGEQNAPQGSLTPPGADADAVGVQRIVFSCPDMKLRIEAGSVARTYDLETCSLPIGSYEAAVRIEKNDFFLTFPSEVSEDQRFDFSYRVKPGQENPAVLLKGQQKVHVDVVDHLTTPPPPPPPSPQPACVVNLKDRQLVAPGSASRDLFKPLKFDRTVWSHSIPLGEFGFVEVNANASGSLTGMMSGHYGPGMLTDICLTHEIGSTPSSAPIKHPLLGPGSHTDVTTIAIGGRARFHLPASAHDRHRRSWQGS